MDSYSDLMRSVVQPIVLKLVNERSMYGYEIIKIVNQRTRNQFQWKEGTLYPCLHRMENIRLIESKWQTTGTGRKGKYYQITRKGKELLNLRLEQWTSFAKAINTILLTA
ncbi:PadR family transcriptional regulator [Verrucomicrobiota bacterium]